METPAQPLTFKCFKCGNESTYNNTLVDDSDSRGGKSVVKRCQVCGIENKVIIPDGWVARPTNTVLRGVRE
jgi:transcription elongation factor Elf1